MLSERQVQIQRILSLTALLFVAASTTNLTGWWLLVDTLNLLVAAWCFEWAWVPKDKSRNHG